MGQKRFKWYRWNGMELWLPEYERGSRDDWICLRYYHNSIQGVRKEVLFFSCPPGESSSDGGAQAGVHRLVESLYGLQGERSKLRGELRLLHSQLEQKERDRHSRIQAFQLQVDDCNVMLKNCCDSVWSIQRCHFGSSSLLKKKMYLGFLFV